MALVRILCAALITSVLASDVAGAACTRKQRSERGEEERAPGEPLRLQSAPLGIRSRLHGRDAACVCRHARDRRQQSRLRSRTLSTKSTARRSPISSSARSASAAPSRTTSAPSCATSSAGRPTRKRKRRRSSSSTSSPTTAPSTVVAGRRRRSSCCRPSARSAPRPSAIPASTVEHDRAARLPAPARRGVGRSLGPEPAAAAAEHHLHPHRRSALGHDRRHALARRRDAGHARAAQRARRLGRRVHQRLHDDAALLSEPLEHPARPVRAHHRRLHERRRARRRRRLRRSARARPSARCCRPPATAPASSAST